MRLGDEIKDFFHFNRGERNGIVILMAILIGVAFFYFIQPSLQTKEPVSNEDELREVEAFLASARKREKEKKWFEKENKMSFFDNERKKKEPEYFPFDPNNLSIKDWQRLGLSEGQARVIKNYEKGGATFKVKTDVLKLYTVDSALYLKLEPYIQLPDNLRKKELSSDYKMYDENEDDISYDKPEKIEVIHLNSADTTELMKVKGIGPYYSKKIVELRQELGGFTNLEQLLEIWKFDTATYEVLKPIASIDLSQIEKIDINSATKEELQAHPYIDWSLANAIVKYREQHGNYSSVDELLEIVILKEEDFQELQPYLKTE